MEILFVSEEGRLLMALIILLAILAALLVVKAENKMYEGDDEIYDDD